MSMTNDLITKQQRMSQVQHKPVTSFYSLK